MVDDHFTVQWAAGVFESSGQIRTWSSYARSFHVELYLPNRERDILETFQRVVGRGEVASLGEERHAWMVADTEDVLWVLQELRRHLHLRAQARADKVIKEIVAYLCHM